VLTGCRGGGGRAAAVGDRDDDPAVAGARTDRDAGVQGRRAGRLRWVDMVDDVGYRLAHPQLDVLGAGGRQARVSSQRRTSLRAGR
jgi:hypothetical protein